MPDVIIQNKVINPSKKYIKVNNPGVNKPEASDIVFKNNLPGNPEAQLTFYNMNDKGGTVISDFCLGQKKSYFPVPGTGNGEATCTLAKLDGNYAYSVSAAGYETLDPIIIIEPQRQTTSVTVIISTLVGAVVGAALMFVLFKTVFNRSQPAP